ncbi:MAG: hypothetical protein AAGJ19_22050 [Myxococcota bacterium]
MTALAIIGYLSRIIYAAGCWWSPERSDLRRSGVVLFSGVVLDALIFRLGRDALPFEAYILARGLTQTYLSLFVVMLLPSSSARFGLAWAASVPFWWVVVALVGGVDPDGFRSQFPLVRNTVTTLVLVAAGIVAVRELRHRLRVGHISLLRYQTIVWSFMAGDLIQLALQTSESGVAHYAQRGVFDAVIFTSCGLLAVWRFKPDRQVIREQYQRDYGGDR